MTRSEIRSLIEETIGVLWGILGMLAWNNNWKIFAYICAGQFFIAMIAAVIFGHKDRLERKATHAE